MEFNYSYTVVVCFVLQSKIIAHFCDIIYVWGYLYEIIDLLILICNIFYLLDLFCIFLNRITVLKLQTTLCLSVCRYAQCILGCTASGFITTNPLMYINISPKHVSQMHLFTWLRPDSSDI